MTDAATALAMTPAAAAAAANVPNNKTIPQVIVSIREKDLAIYSFRKIGAVWHCTVTFDDGSYSDVVLTAAVPGAELATLATIQARLYLAALGP
jgi:hypothetical protein